MGAPDPFVNAKRPLIMGILNVTPDSFSGDGLLQNEGAFPESVVEQAVQMVADGADILDIGGESTRPGATPVSVEEELLRTIPVFAAVHAKLPEVPLSIDTMKPEVAAEAVAAGATIINDISGIVQKAEMRRLAEQSGVYLVLMHNQAKAEAFVREETIGGEYQAASYSDVVQDVVEELRALAAVAMADGVAREKIILDPGIGFGKTPQQNMRLINHLDQIAALGYPVLLGASRKSFIGRALDLPPEERLEGTAAVTAIGALRGAAIMRVHDVRFMARVAQMTKAIAES